MTRKEKSIIPRTAWAQIRYRKSTGLLVGFCILLTTTLIMLIGTCTLGIVRYQQKNVKVNVGDFHGAYARINDEEYRKIKASTAFAEIGSMEKIAETETDGAIGMIYMMDETLIRMRGSFSLAEGRLPVAANEIAAPKLFFERLGYQGVIGEEVALTYRILGEGAYVEQKFVVSGLSVSTEVEEMSGRFPCLVSEQYADQVLAGTERIRGVFFKLTGEENYNAAQLEEKIRQATAELGIDERLLSVNGIYLLFAISPSPEMIATGAFLTVLVVFFSSLVIYNIFYVGIVGRIQEFGKIRSLGASKRQLKGMVFLEGIFLGGCAVPGGILLGGILAQLGFKHLIYETGSVTGKVVSAINLWHPAIVLLTVAVVFFTIWLSLRKPMRIVSRISSVEAIRHENRTEGLKIKKKQAYRDVTLLRLTVANLARNKKRTLMSILALGFSSILFVIIANVGACLSVEDLARRMVEKGDFQISLDAAVHDEAYPEKNLSALQGRGLLNDEFVAAVAAIPGVTNVSVRKGAAFRWKGGAEEQYGILTAISREDWEERQKNVAAGEMDYDKIAGQGGFVFTSDYWLDYHGLRLGEKLSLMLDNGQTQTMAESQLMAVTNSMDSFFIMPEEGFARLGLRGNTNYLVFIDCNENMAAAVETSLKKLLSEDEAYQLVSYREELSQYRVSLRLLVIPAYGLLVALGLIGFTNMANTIITGIITRKRELGILQAIGLTDRQMHRMFQWEGFALTAGTLFLALTLGNGLGYAAYAWMRDNYILEIKEYHFPVLETVIFVSTLILMQLVLSYACSRRIRKESIIERVRHLG